MPLNIIDNHFQQRRRHAPSTTDDPTCGASMPKRAAATTTTDPKRAAVEAAAPTAVIDPKRAAVEAAAPAASIDVLDRDLLSSVLLHLYSTEAAPAVRGFGDVVTYKDDSLLADLRAVALTSRAFRAAAADEHLWKQICTRHFPDTALLPGVTKWKRLYRMRRGPPQFLAPCAPHSLADAPSIGLDDVHVLCELWPSRHDERARIAKLYDTDGASGRVTSGGVLVLALPLGKHEHDCGHKKCSKAVWSVPELRYMHASDHCRPLVRNLALWSRSLQALAWISFAGASVDAAHIEPSRNAVARSSPTQYLGGMMVNTYLLDLAPAYETFSRALGAFVRLDVSFDFPNCEVDIDWQRSLRTEDGDKNIPCEKSDLPHIMPTLDWRVPSDALVSRGGWRMTGDLADDESSDDGSIDDDESDEEEEEEGEEEGEDEEEEMIVPLPPLPMMEAIPPPNQAPPSAPLKIEEWEEEEDEPTEIPGGAEDEEEDEEYERESKRARYD